jgi:polyphosphate kinase 2 (PPK2 family)
MGCRERALVACHARMIARHERALVIVEGADGAGKSSLIERISHIVACRTVALGPPAPDEPYFQRWLAHLPAAGELALFDRSWYNRAALEPVHGLCTAAQRDAFLAAVPGFERLLAAAGIRVIKLFLAVRLDTQARRLAVRANPTPLDRAAIAVGPAMRAAHAQMIARTPSWIVIDNDEPHGRIDAIAAIVTALEVRDGSDADPADVPRSVAR